MNKLYIFFMMLATLGLAVPAFAGQALPSAEVSTEAAAPLSKKEAKAQKRAMRKALRKAAFKSVFKRNKKENAKPAADVLAIILAILVPPVGVWYYQGRITTDFWLSLGLWVLLGGIPGIVYALLVVFDVISLA